MPKVSDEHVEARRNQILEAACACIGRSGFRQTTIRDICEESGLSAGAVYGYFKSKDEIIEAIAELGRRNTRSFLESHLVEDRPARGLSRMMGAIADFFASEAGLPSARLDVSLWGEAIHTPRIRKLFLDSFANTNEPFVAAIRGAQGQGEINPEVDPGAAARLFIAVGLGLAVQRAMDPDADLGGCGAAIAAVIDGSFSTKGRET